MTMPLSRILATTITSVAVLAGPIAAPPPAEAADEITLNIARLETFVGVGNRASTCDDFKSNTTRDATEQVRTGETLATNVELSTSGPNGSASARSAATFIPTMTTHDGAFRSFSYTYDYSTSATASGDCGAGAQVDGFTILEFVITQPEIIELSARHNRDTPFPADLVIIGEDVNLTIEAATTANVVRVPLASGEYQIATSISDFANQGGQMGVASSANVATLNATIISAAPPPANDSGHATGKTRGRATPYLRFPRRIDCTKNRAVVRLLQPQSKPRAKVATVKAGPRKVTRRDYRKAVKVTLSRVPDQTTKITARVKLLNGKTLKASRRYNTC